MYGLFEVWYGLMEKLIEILIVYLWVKVVVGVDVV